MSTDKRLKDVSHANKREKKLGSRCTSCKMSCESITEKQREWIFNKSKSKTREQQVSYIVSLVDKIPVKQSKVEKATSRRSCSYEYWLQLEDGAKKRVCKKMFASTFGISPRTVGDWLSKFKTEFTGMQSQQQSTTQRTMPNQVLPMQARKIDESPQNAGSTSQSLQMSPQTATSPQSPGPLIANKAEAQAQMQNQQMRNAITPQATNSQAPWSQTLPKDYSQPKDLSTIKRKLDAEQYEEPHETSLKKSKVEKPVSQQACSYQYSPMPKFAKENGAQEQILSSGVMSGDISSNKDVAVVKAQEGSAPIMATIMHPQMSLSNNTPAVWNQPLTSISQSSARLAMGRGRIAAINQGGVTLGEDYSQPKDLSTIKRKLDAEQYEEPHETSMKKSKVEKPVSQQACSHQCDVMPEYVKKNGVQKKTWMNGDCSNADFTSAKTQVIAAAKKNRQTPVPMAAGMPPRTSLPSNTPAVPNQQPNMLQPAIMPPPMMSNQMPPMQTHNIGKSPQNAGNTCQSSHMSVAQMQMQNEQKANATTQQSTKLQTPGTQTRPKFDNSDGQTTATTTDSHSRPQQEDRKPLESQPNEATKPSSFTSNSSHSRLNSTARYPFRKHFPPETLLRYLMPIFEKLYNMDPESLYFRQPVDPKMSGNMVRKCIFCTIIITFYAKYRDWSF